MQTKSKPTYTTIYPRNWRNVSRIIRRLAAGRCEWCGCETNELSVHHIGAPYADDRPGSTRDKHDLRRENLVALCEDCHEGVDHISKVREQKARRDLKRRIRLEQHRALGVGVGLVAC